MRPAFQLKRHQYLLAGLFGCFGLFAMGALIWSVDDAPKAPKESEASPTIKIATAGQRLNPQEIWVERLESENKLTQSKLEALEKLLLSQKTGQKEASLSDPAKTPTETNSLGNPEDPDERDEEADTSAMPSTGEHVLPISPFPSPGLPAESVQMPPQTIRKIVLKLTNRMLPDGKDQEKATIEDTVPAGTFAKAVLLGGVDASTAVNAQADPRPILLRISDDGTLPRHFKSDLCDCHVLASSYGDLSSERVYMRLEKLTCTERLTGEISETEVSGYIVGEDGRAGVRGVVADRAGPMLRNSLLGGFFSGMSQFFGASHQPAAFFPLGVVQPAQSSLQQMFSGSASQGSSKALEKYAEFFIQRAEQLQPVLQIAAGREVDIVFTQGTKFGETSVKKSLTKIRETVRKQAIQNLEDHPDSRDWLPPTPEGDTP